MRRKYTYTYRDKFAQMCACVVCVCVCMLCVFLCIVHVCTGCMCLFSFCSHASSLEKERGRTVRGSGKRLWGAVRVGFFILAKRRGGLISGLIILGVYDSFNQFTGSLSAQLDFYANIFQLVPYSCCVSLMLGTSSQYSKQILIILKYKTSSVGKFT